MEIIYGKHTRVISTEEFLRLRNGHANVLLDLGTGDGRFVVHTARADSQVFVVGLDACRENLRDASRSAPSNVLFVIANACCLPEGLYHTANRITVNFPWGSLRDGLLTGDSDLLDGLRAVMRPGAQIEVRLNASALEEAGCTLTSGGEMVYGVLNQAGFRAARPVRLMAEELRSYPTTWSKRLAFGRAPEAMLVQAVWLPSAAEVVRVSQTAAVV